MTELPTSAPPEIIAKVKELDDRLAGLSQDEANLIEQIEDIDAERREVRAVRRAYIDAAEICLRPTAVPSPQPAGVDETKATAPAPAAPSRRRRSPTEIRLDVFGALSILNGVPQQRTVRVLMEITSAAKSTVEGALAYYQKLGQAEEVSPGTWRKRLPDPAAAVTEAASSGDFAAEAQPLRVPDPEGAASATAANSLASQTPEAGSPEDRLKTDAEIFDFVLSCGSVGASETQMSLVGASPAQIDRLVENGDLLWSSDDHFYRVPEPVITDEAAS